MFVTKPTRPEPRLSRSDAKPMHWKLITPFLATKEQPWLHHEIASPGHDFDVVVSTYDHDRSRQRASAREWLDFAWHATRGMVAVLASRRRPVGIITAFPQLPVLVGSIKRLTGSRMPVVAWFFNLGRRFDGPRRRLAAFGLAGVDVFIVHSRREISIYADMFGLPKERFVFVPFTQELDDPGFEEDQETPFVLSMGTSSRDYPTFLQAIGRLGYRTIIVASPHAVDGLEVPPCVTIRSGLPLEECQKLCQQARVNVVPLANDETASGQVTLRDAMMLGKAVVATQSIGTEDYIESGVTGILVPPRDPDALVAAIADLWENPGRRVAIGAAARAWVQEHASFEVGPRRLFEILEGLRLKAAR